MKKNILVNIIVVFSILMLVGCSKEQKQNVTLEIWHYYNGTQKISFDQSVIDFNETVGLEKGIIVEAFSQGNISQLEEKIMDSVEEKVGASQVPDMVTIYPEIAYDLNQREMIANLEDYISETELDVFVDSYVAEGRLGEEGQFKIFPTAKATEIMMVNKTDWDKFSEATGAKVEDLETWEGIGRVAKSYYEWTDGLTKEENDGKAFFGRDALANYMLVGSKQLGQEIFTVEGEKITVNIQEEIMRKLWDNYYIPYINGYYTSFGRFSTDDAKIGEIIALVGSTTGATYFPENVTIGDSESYEIDLLVLPLPNFENTEKTAVQQGAGIVVLKSDKAHEEASVEFLKWFTEESRNLGFSIETGYLPVKKAAYDTEKMKTQFQEEIDNGLPKQLQLTIPKAMEQIDEYNLYVSKAFTQGGKARAVLASMLQEQAKIDREKVKEKISQGMTHEEAIMGFSSDEYFKEWVGSFKERLMEAVEQ